MTGFGQKYKQQVKNDWKETFKDSVSYKEGLIEFNKFILLNEDHTIIWFVPGIIVAFGIAAYTLGGNLTPLMNSYGPPVLGTAIGLGTAATIARNIAVAAQPRLEEKLPKSHVTFIFVAAFPVLAIGLVTVNAIYALAKEIRRGYKAIEIPLVSLIKVMTDKNKAAAMAQSAPLVSGTVLTPAAPSSAPAAPVEEITEEKMTQAVSAMPEEQRQAFLDALQKKFNPAAEEGSAAELQRPVPLRHVDWSKLKKTQ